MWWRRMIVLILAGMGWAFPAKAADSLTFGVLSQRSAVLTAQYWNPVLEYVSRKVGIPLMLRAARTAPESNAAIEAGDYDFVYSNTIFNPQLAKAGYRPVLRPRADAVRAQIVTLKDSPVRSVQDLNGLDMGFPSLAAFLGYAVPMDHLLRQGVTVNPVFGGNQEGIMAQLKAGRVLAAGVNGQVMQAFSKRENMPYRVLWESVPFHNIPIAAHPRVPEAVRRAVTDAFAGMADDPAGLAILAASAQLVTQDSPYGFLPAEPDAYKAYEEFYRSTLVKDIR